MVKNQSDNAGWKVALLVCALLCAEGRLGWAQDVSRQGNRVVLGDVSGTARGQVMVPVYLTRNPPETRIGGIDATVVFESKIVTFERAEKGFLLDGVGGVLEAQETTDSDNPGWSRLRFRVMTQGEPRKSLPEGLVVSLLFQIGPDASPGTVVPLKLETVAVSDPGAPPKELPGTVSTDGSIEVITPGSIPLVGCFFFTH